MGKEGAGEFRIYDREVKRINYAGVARMAVTHPVLLARQGIREGKELINHVRSRGYGGGAPEGETQRELPHQATVFPAEREPVHDTPEQILQDLRDEYRQVNQHAVRFGWKERQFMLKYHMLPPDGFYREYGMTPPRERPQEEYRVELLEAGESLPQGSLYDRAKQRSRTQMMQKLAELRELFPHYGHIIDQMEHDFERFEQQMDAIRRGEKPDFDADATNPTDEPNQ